MPTDVSSNSMADSRAKVHLTRHQPIHAQNFTTKSPRLKYHVCALPQRAATYQLDRGVPFSKGGPTCQLDPTFLFLTSKRRNIKDLPVDFRAVMWSTFSQLILRLVGRPVHCLLLPPFCVFRFLSFFSMCFFFILAPVFSCRFQLFCSQAVCPCCPHVMS